MELFQLFNITHYQDLFSAPKDFFFELLVRKRCSWLGYKLICDPTPPPHLSHAHTHAHTQIQVCIELVSYMWRWNSQN